MNISFGTIVFAVVMVVVGLFIVTAALRILYRWLHARKNAQKRVISESDKSVIQDL